MRLLSRLSKLPGFAPVAALVLGGLAAANRAAAIAKMLHDNFEARQVFSEPTVGAYYVLQRR